MVSIVSQVLIGLLTTLIGIALGVTWRLSHQRIVYWRARHFWRPFISEDLKIVIGKFREFDSFEFSGLVGVGDMQAAAEIVAFFSGLGFRRQSGVDIVYQDQLRGELYGANLICVCGPDGNRVTERLLRRINHTIDFHDATSLHDDQTDMDYRPEFEVTSDGHKDITLDYGVLIKASNPFDSRHTVMITAGCYGYGTWAGAKLAASSPFLRNELVQDGNDVECLFRVEIVEEFPQIPEIVIIRKIGI